MTDHFISGFNPCYSSYPFTNSNIRLWIYLCRCSNRRLWFSSIYSRLYVLANSPTISPCYPLSLVQLSMILLIRYVLYMHLSILFTIIYSNFCIYAPTITPLPESVLLYASLYFSKPICDSLSMQLFMLFLSLNLSN